MLQRLSLKLQHLYAAGVDNRCHLLFYFLKRNHDTGYLHASARTAGTGADKHDEQQDCFGKLRPAVVINGGVSRCGDNGGNLERRLVECHKQGREQAPDIDGDEQDGNGHHSQISPQLLTPPRILGPAYEQQVVHIEIHAKKQHKNGDDSLLVHRVIRLP